MLDFGQCTKVTPCCKNIALQPSIRVSGLEGWLFAERDPDLREMPLVIPPAARRPGVEGLAHLPHAGGLHGAFRSVELEAFLVPLEATIREQLLNGRAWVAPKPASTATGVKAGHRVVASERVTFVIA